ncbi:hypothetical protein KI387_022255, partial [Taxus chinensis]
MENFSPKHWDIWDKRTRTGRFGRNREIQHWGKWDKGTRGTRIAEGAEKVESQSDCATCHQQIRDREAHFGGRIG